MSNYNKVQYLRYRESRIICSYFGFNYSTLIENKKKDFKIIKTNNKYNYYGETIHCKENETDLTKCKFKTLK